LRWRGRLRSTGRKCCAVIACYRKTSLLCQCHLLFWRSVLKTAKRSLMWKRSIKMVIRSVCCPLMLKCWSISRSWLCLKWSAAMCKTYVNKKEGLFNFFAFHLKPYIEFVLLTFIVCNIFSGWFYHVWSMEW